MDEAEREVAVARINTLMRHVGDVLTEEFARIIPVINNAYHELERIGAITPTQRAGTRRARRYAHYATQARHTGRRNQR